MSEERARALMTNIDTRLWQLRLIRDDGRDATQFRVSPIPFFTAARHDLIALGKDIETLKTYVTDNAANLNIEFWDPKIQAYEMELLGLDGVLPIPQLTMEDAAREQLTGTCVEVDDGDTILVDDGVSVKEIRFAMVDAPEKYTPLGRRAKKHLEDLALNKQVTVYYDKNQSVETYGRVLGVAYVGDLNLNLDMIRTCLCKPLDKYGRHDHISLAELQDAAEACGKAGPDRGIVKIMSGKTHANIWVDGIDTGHLTPAILKLPIGTHTIMATVIDHTPDQVTIEVGRGEMEVKLYPLKMPYESGIVEVVSTPTGAAFLLDGTPMGKTPTSFETSIGEHTIVFSAEGHSPETARIMLSAGQRIKIDAILTKK